MSAPKKMPDWAYNQMIDGLTKLIILRLQGSPPSDGIEAVAMVWEEALSNITHAWRIETDGERLKIAFLHLMQHSTHWVTPAQLIAQIPPRHEIFMPIAHKPAPISQEERDKNRAHIQAILKQLMSKITIT